MRSLLCLLFLAATAYADPPPMPPAPSPVPTPAAPPFILPVVPTPTPPPAPVGTPIPLVPGHPFVVRLNAAIVLASPEGMVKMKTKAEPLTVVDADGADTECTGDKSVCFVWPVKGASGLCELLIVPNDGSAVGRVSLIVGGGPVPPTPPGPGPNPPTPTDPLTATLQAAYTADAATNKGASLELLQLAWRGIASTVSDQKLPTVAAAATWIKTAEESFLPDTTRLTAVRKAITADLTTAIGPPNATTGFDPAKLKAEVSRISTAIGGVK